MIDIAQLEIEIAQFIISAGWAREFTNGEDTYSFTTDSGTKISFAKAIKDFQDDAETRLTVKEQEFLTSLAAKELSWDQSLATREGEWDNSAILANVTNLVNNANTALIGAEAARDASEGFRDEAEAAKAVVIGANTTQHVVIAANSKSSALRIDNFPANVLSMMLVTNSSNDYPTTGTLFVDRRSNQTTENLNYGYRELHSSAGTERYYQTADGEGWQDWKRIIFEDQAGLVSLASANISGDVDISGSLTIGNQDLTNPESVPNIAQADARYGAEYIFTALPLPAADANGLIILDTDILPANLPFDPFWVSHQRGSMSIQIDLQYLLGGQSFNNRIIYNLTTKLVDGYIRVDEQQHVTASEVHVAVGFTVDFQNHPTTNALQLHIQLLSTNSDHWTSLYLKGVVKP